MTGNPKKAAILGLLGVVALYFWAPLVAGWFKDEKPTTATAPAKPPIAESATTLPAIEAKPTSEKPAKPKEPTASWQQVVAWMDADSRTEPAEPLAVNLSPFRTPKLAEAPAQKVALPEIAHEITPQGANLVLTSTIVGSGLDVARINGKSFRPGDKLAIKLKNGQKLEYAIVAIETRRVVLERLGKQYELNIQAPQASGTIEMVGNTR